MGKMKMKKSVRILPVLWMALFLTVIPGVLTAQAASLKQKGIQQNAITVQWENPVTESYRTLKGYTVEYKKPREKSSQFRKFKDLPASATSVTITGLEAGTKYNIKVIYHYTSKYSSSNSAYLYLYDGKTLVGDIQNLVQDKWYYFINTFWAAWNHQDASSGYEYICTDSKGKTKAKGTLTTNRVEVQKIKNTMIYSFKVRAFTTYEGKKYYGKWSKSIYCFTQPRIKSAKVKSKKLTVKWDTVSGATGYAIYVSTKEKTGYKLAKTVSAKKGSAKIKKLNGKKFKKKKKYYVYVQTLKKVDGRVSTSGQLYFWNTKNSSYGYLK